MKTDGLFTVHECSIPVRSGKPVSLILWGDVHRDSPNHAEEEWKAFLDKCRSRKDAWYLGLGDYVDSASTSERNCLAGISDKLHESTLGDISKLAAMKVELLAKELSFMRGRLVGLMNGNHYFQFQDGTNTDMCLCKELGCPYLGVSTFVRLTLDYGGRKTTLDIWAHHGSGAARLPGGSINRVDQMREHAEADIYVMGHDHKRGIWPANPRMYLANTTNGPSLKSRQQWLVRSGSFLLSYQHGKRSYNVDAGRGPSSIGAVEIVLTLTSNGGKCTPDRVAIQGLV